MNKNVIFVSELMYFVTLQLYKPRDWRAVQSCTKYFLCVIISYFYIKFMCCAFDNECQNTISKLNIGALAIFCLSNLFQTTCLK